MIRIACAAALAALVAAPATASPQLRALVEQRLPSWGYSDVDVDALSTAQVAQIHHIIHSERPHGEKETLLRAVLRGGYTLPRGPSAF